jgi:hypothetical protein
VNGRGYMVGQSALPAWLCEMAYHWLGDIAREHGHSGGWPLPEGLDADEIELDGAVRAVVCAALCADSMTDLRLVHTAWHSNAPRSHGIDPHPHRDDYQPHGRADCVRVWWFPRAVGPMDGPIWVAPGSQHSAFPPDPTTAVPILVRAGGFVVVHADLWHWQGPNGTDRPRIMVRLEFARKEAHDAV